LKSIFLPELKSYKFKAIAAKRNQQLDINPTNPMIPKWFGVSPAPCKAKLPRPPRVIINGRDLRPLTVFNPEDRRMYNDTRYPWGTICKVITYAGTGSGVIISSDMC